MCSFGWVITPEGRARRAHDALWGAKVIEQVIAHRAVLSNALWPCAIQGVGLIAKLSLNRAACIKLRHQPLAGIKVKRGAARRGFAHPLTKRVVAVLRQLVAVAVEHPR